MAYLVALALNITLRIYELINNNYRVTILNQAAQIGDIGEQNTPIHKKIVCTLRSGEHYLSLLTKSQNDPDLYRPPSMSTTILAPAPRIENGNDCFLNFSIIGNNVNGFNGIKKRTAVFHNLLDKGDIILMQETHLDGECE